MFDFFRLKLIFLPQCSHFYEETTPTLGAEWAIMDLYIIHIYVLTFISKSIYDESYPDRSHFEKKA